MAAHFRRQFGVLLAVSTGIALAAASNAALADTITGFIGDNTSFAQTSNSAPTTPFGYFFYIGAFFSTPGDFTTGSASYPGSGSPQTLFASGSSELLYETGYFSSLSALHAKYPFGTYTITASGPAGTQTAAIPYSADYFSSDIPYLTNYSSLAGLDPAANFTADFPGYTPNPATNLAYTFFTVYDATTGAIVLSDGFLPPTATSATIPANTLLPDTVYDFELNYDNRIAGSDTINGTFTQQQFDMRTDGSFTTGAIPAVPEPGSLALLGSGLLGLALLPRRRQV